MPDDSRLNVGAAVGAVKKGLFGAAAAFVDSTTENIAVNDVLIQRGL